MSPRSKTRSALLCAFFPLVAVAVIDALFPEVQRALF